MSSLLDEVSAIAARIADPAAPSVVRLEGRGRGGSGVVIGDGRILTNAHNVHDERLAVVIAGDSREATVVGTDLDGDMAVLGADTSGTRPLPFAGHAPVVGSAVFALAAGSSGPRVTFGLVSAVGRSFRGPRGRRISGSIEHTAAMAPGSSGSALLDATGQLVGLNTHRMAPGFYLALPTDETLRARIESLAAGRSPRRPRLGVAVAPAWAARRMRAAVGLEPRDGLLVREVEEAGPAAAAGILAGDLIVAVDERPVVETDDLVDALEAATGESVRVALMRGSEARTVVVALAAEG